MSFQLGDKVKIRNWDKLIELGEYLGEYDGDIYFSKYSDVFVKSMKPFCGQVCTIVSWQVAYENHKKYILQHKGSRIDYHFYDDMLTPCIVNDPKGGNDEEKISMPCN